MESSSKIECLEVGALLLCQNKLPNELEKFTFLQNRAGGRFKTTVSFGNTEWRRAVWYDTKASSYLLPVKALVR